MRSIRRVLAAMGRWLEERVGLASMLKPLLEHRVPPTGWDYAIGSAALVAFIVQVVTGVALAFSYVPAPNSAYESIQFITDQAMLGNVVRALHFWGASAMVLLVVLHAAQVFLVGSYKYPREMNWLSGSVLLLLTFGLAFTGQLLRWNQDAYWAVVVGAAQAARAPIIGEWLTGLLFAGQTVGGATLTRFYATHVFLLPAAVFGLLGLHLYLVIRHGVSDPPVPGEPVDKKTYKERYEQLLARIGVPFWPDAAWKDVVLALVVGSVVLALAIFVGPPALGNRADPLNIQADPRPDWYFLWYFALLALLPASIEDWFIVGFPLLIGVVFLALPFIAPTGERSPRRRPWAVAGVALIALSLGVLIRLGDRAPWSPTLEASTLPESVTRGLTPAQARGADLFVQKGCLACHRLGDQGGERGPELTTVGSRLTRDEMTWRILNGGHNMPAYATALTPDEVDSLLDFLGSTGGGRAAGRAP